MIITTHPFIETMIYCYFIETIIFLNNNIIFWLVVWDIFYFPFHIWDVILPIDDLIFFIFHNNIIFLKNNIIFFIITSLFLERFCGLAHMNSNKKPLHRASFAPGGCGAPGDSRTSRAADLWLRDQRRRQSGSAASPGTGTVG